MKPNEPSCSNCTLQDYTYVRPYFPETKQHNFLFVGQAPGKVETVTGQPFTGPAGKMLWRLLKEAGINKLKTDTTNVAKCAPPDDRKPDHLEIACCHQFLYEDIHYSKPELIIALGDVASKALTGDTKIMSNRGSFKDLLPQFNFPCKVLICLHPSFVMRQRQWIDISIDDFKKAISYIESDGQIIVDDEPELITEVDEHFLERYLEEASKVPSAFDTETTGLNPRTSNVIGASICYEHNRAIAFDLHASDPRWRPFTKYLEDKNAKKVTQNGQFDIAMLDAHGINTKGLAFDTRLAEHILESDLPGNLDFLRSKYTEIKPYKPTKKEMKEIAHWEASRRNKYAALDALTTYQVYEKQSMLMDHGNMKVLQEIELPLVYVLNAMEKRGIQVDMDTLDSLKDKTLPRSLEIKTNHFDPIDLNPNSPKQLMKFFGIATTGEASIMKYIKNNHPQRDLMALLLEYRSLHKMHSVYIDGVTKRLEYGRIHTHYKLDGTATGRLSSENPNLQNVPKPMRIIYIPDPGNVLIEADYNQLELRVLAVVAMEEVMIEELWNGRSTHHAMGEIIFGKKWEDLESYQRVWVKNVVFGTAYGRGPTAIARQFGVTIREAEQWQSLCIKRYKGLMRYRKNQEQIYNTTRRCTTPFGRTRQIDTVTKALNTPIQSSGSDICLKALIKLHEQGFHLCMTVHDSITIQADKQTWKDQARALKNVMEEPVPELFDKNFPVSVAVGPNWKDMKDYAI